MSTKEVPGVARGYRIGTPFMNLNAGKVTIEFLAQEVRICLESLEQFFLFTGQLNSLSSCCAVAY